MASFKCNVCDNVDAKYTCPRCNARYCSLECYKNHSGKCTEEFQMEGFSQELSNVTAGPEEKKKMGAILVRLHRQQLEDEQGISGNGGGGGSDLEEEDDESEDEEELVDGLPYNRAILLADGSITLEDLSDSELAAFKRAIVAGDLTDIVQPWKPWWTSEEAARLELSPNGTRLMVELENIVNYRNNDTEETAGGVEIAHVVAPVLPPPPSTALPPLSSLISKPPSPAVALHLLDLLFSYCLVLRLYNGQYNDDVIGAAETLLAISAVLGSTRNPPGEESKSTNPAAVLADAVAHACSSKAGQGNVPRGFAVGVLEDVARVLEQGRSVVITALMDLSRLIKGGHKEAKEVSSLEKTSRGSKNKGTKDLAINVLPSSLKKAQQKLVYFLSFANELPPLAYIALAAQAAALYEEQKTMLRALPKDTVVLK